MSDRLGQSADVLIIGGGMSTAWAAIAAAQEGARTVIVDKGFTRTVTSRLWAVPITGGFRASPAPMTPIRISIPRARN